MEERDETPEDISWKLSAEAERQITNGGINWRKANSDYPKVRTEGEVEELRDFSTEDLAEDEKTEIGIEIDRELHDKAESVLGDELMDEVIRVTMNMMVLNGGEGVPLGYEDYEEIYTKARKNVE